MLIAALVAVVGIVAISNVGTQAADKLNTVANLLESSGTSAADEASNTKSIDEMMKLPGAIFRNSDGSISFLSWEQLCNGDGKDEYGHIGSIYWDTSSWNITNSKIGSYAFINCDSIISVTIPSGISYIEGCAFECCPNLVNVSIPEGVQSIGPNCFDGCSSLTTITLPLSIHGLGDCLFNRAPLLTDLRYAGTVADWEATGIEYNPGTNLWAAGRAFSQIHCSDGDTANFYPGGQGTSN